MAKIRSISDLQDALDRESSWRLKELDALNRQAHGLGGHWQTSMLRANVAILYAHWEGFVKSSSMYYVEYVSRRSLKVSELQDCFAFLALRRSLNDISSTRKAEMGVEALRFLRLEINKSHKLSFNDAIRTDSNLSSSVFRNILQSIGLDYKKYQPYENLIDQELLKRRNHVAHGEFIDLDSSSYSNLFAEILKLMKWFKNDIENAVTLELYRVA